MYVASYVIQNQSKHHIVFIPNIHHMQNETKHHIVFIPQIDCLDLTKQSFMIVCQE